MSLPFSLIATFDDATLVSTACETLGFSVTRCKHCGHKPVPLDRFVVSMRRRAEKKGALTAANFPKSCDKQMASNDKSNPINNKYYNSLKPEMPAEVVLAVLKARDDEIVRATDLKPRPLVFRKERALDPKDVELARLKAALAAAEERATAAEERATAAEERATAAEARASAMEDHAYEISQIAAAMMATA